MLIVTKSGDVRMATVSVSPLTDGDGNILGVLGIARDITATKKIVGANWRR